MGCVRVGFVLCEGSKWGRPSQKIGQDLKHTDAADQSELQWLQIARVACSPIQSLEKQCNSHHRTYKPWVVFLLWHTNLLASTVIWFYLVVSFPIRYSQSLSLLHRFISASVSYLLCNILDVCDYGAVSQNLRPEEVVNEFLGFYSDVVENCLQWDVGLCHVSQKKNTSPSR